MPPERAVPTEIAMVPCPATSMGLGAMMQNIRIPIEGGISVESAPEAAMQPSESLSS